MSEQLNLGIKPSRVENIEKYDFEPIKGYPMLNWKGKRPFTSTQYYPAQLKENYGEPVEGWTNQIYWGDNLQVMSHLLKKYRGQVNLIYIDPPFDSKADYKKKISLRDKQVNNDITAFEEKQYTDIWSNDEYLQFMYERLILMRELLSDNGSIYLHCDPTKSHHLRCLLDEIFSQSKFINEIVVCYTGPTNQKNNFPRKHDIVFYYSKENIYTFNENFARINYKKSNHSTGKTSLAGRAEDKYLDELDEKGKIIEDYWIDIRTGSHIPKDIRESGDSYPTLKDTKILERIIKVSSNPGDLVFDCFMGSGTTQAVAMKLGRRFIGADINLGAIQTTTKRLINISKELDEKLIKDNSEDIKNYYTSFSVYNVNHYDIFRNPIQAKELLIEALEINPYEKHGIYDGEKDGRMVKIMPVNRIATSADLNELITGFDYKTFEKRYEDNPNKPVEKLLLVCMGHEPDLSATLQKEVSYKLDIEVVDILRDKSKLEFKRDPESDIIIEDGFLVIKSFYPMNLLQKLSLMKENVEDWRELVDSIIIDWNYDGSILEPAKIDIPEKNNLVEGKYKIPSGAGTIKVKITDLLSESLEVEIENV